MERVATETRFSGLCLMVLTHRSHGFRVSLSSYKSDVFGGFAFLPTKHLSLFSLLNSHPSQCLCPLLQLLPLLFLPLPLSIWA